MTFEIGQIDPVLLGQGLLFGNIHLTMQDIDSFGTQSRGPFNDLMNGHFRFAEMPIGVGGDGESDPWFQGNDRGAFNWTWSEGGSNPGRSQGSR